jgi:Holliday junction resolvasome RuvABC endonuclease subunit
MPKKTKTILAVDPGLRDLGFAVLRGRRLATAGVEPLRLLPAERRHYAALRCVRELIRSYGPGVLVLETTARHSLSWLDAVDRLARSLRRLARREGAIVATYAAQTVRKSVVGNGRARKREVAEALAARFPELRVFLTQDRRWKERYFQNLFDALALALHHEKRR